MNFKYLSLSILVSLMGNAIAGSQSWVGGNTTEKTNGTPIPIATIGGVKTRSSDNIVRFKINERNDLVFHFDGSTTAGKNILANILSAKSSGSEVTFKADCGTYTYGTECGIDEVIFGSAIF